MALQPSRYLLYYPKQPYFCQTAWKRVPKQRFSDGSDEEMKDDIDSVRGLLDRFKEDKERELLKETSSSSTYEDGYSSAGENLVCELVQKSTKSTLVMNLKPVSKTRETSTKMGLGDAAAGDDEGESSGKGVSQKRKQDSFLVEVQERAEVISKSARKAPETVVSSIGQNVEGDPDTEEFLRKIRAAPSSSNEFRMENNETRPFRSKSASEVDLSVVVPVRDPLVCFRESHYYIQYWICKSRSGTYSHFNFRMEEDHSVTPGGGFIIKNPPQWDVGEAVRPRTKPKPKVKSKTVSGIALPGLADALIKKQIAAENKQRSQGSAAEIVRSAAENKKNMSAKEDKLEKEHEKPAWLVEAEARRKLHEQRRHPKSKDQGESETSQGPEKPVNNGPVLKSLPQKPEVGKKKSVGGGVMSVFRNIVLRPVRKPDAVPTKSEDDSDATKSFNVCLRPVSKAGPLDNQADEIKGSFQPVRLKPIAPRLSRPLSSSVTNTEATPMRTRTPPEKTSTSQSVQQEKSAREYHTVPLLAPITLERSEPRVSESFSSPTNGERVTISSNYLSGPHKLPPSTTPKPSNRSKTVTFDDFN
ncbi:uncharacterized protein LOC113675478 [Pocillopora damicornis]|uniref:uncharacterized protein LOC113675478 n=1 Tax=Pocillopora damicornis TaxID=46731 RepID=UPI000F55720C|nr:uncharacterized protein LOC113675478 [Pocillopora damicornis]